MRKSTSAPSITASTASGNIRWFRDIRLADVGLVGGKNASLGELFSVLSVQGVRVPNGFALTADAYRNALTEAGAESFSTQSSRPHKSVSLTRRPEDQGNPGGSRAASVAAVSGRLTANTRCGGRECRRTEALMRFRMLRGGADVQTHLDPY
jgi:pyruvate phosphate dikinase-like enzyme